MKVCNITDLSYSVHWQTVQTVYRGINLMILKQGWIDGIGEKNKFAYGDDNAFMLNDCKYLYNMYRRYSMLNLVILPICITIVIIRYYVCVDKTTYFCTNASLLCTVGSIDVLFIAVLKKLFK